MKRLWLFLFVSAFLAALVIVLPRTTSLNRETALSFAALAELAAAIVALLPEARRPPRCRVYDPYFLTTADAASHSRWTRKS